MSAPPPAVARLEARALAKAFPGVQALDGVDLALAAGEVHALCGENGAGKSTLVRILAGLERADGGAILLDGRAIAPRSPREALALGIATIHQEVALVPDLSVAENVLLGRQPRGLLGIDRRAMRERARAAIARVGLALDVRARAGDLSVAEKQRVAIARALDLCARVLLMDEPTSSLDAREAGALLELVRGLARSGLAVAFIAHDLGEVERLADRVSVLRGGRRVATLARGAYTRIELVRHMLGREAALAASVRAPRAGNAGALVLEARGLGRAGTLAPTDCVVRAGEIVGVAGLLGAGKSELVRLAYGAEPKDAGTLAIGGAPIARPTPRRSVAAGAGYCPEDRRAEAIFPSLSVAENLVIAHESLRGWRALCTRARRRRRAAELVRALGIACSSLDQPVRTLSGGNQQKVVLGRWLAASPRVLLLDEPTRGVDVGAKAEILARIARLADEGLGVLCVSSSLEELGASAGRILVLHARARTAELVGPDYDERALVAAMAGGADAHGA